MKYFLVCLNQLSKVDTYIHTESMFELNLRFYLFIFFFVQEHLDVLVNRQQCWRIVVEKKLVDMKVWKLSEYWKESYLYYEDINCYSILCEHKIVRCDRDNCNRDCKAVASKKRHSKHSVSAHRIHPHNFEQGLWFNSHSWHIKIAKHSRWDHTGGPCVREAVGGGT